MAADHALWMPAPPSDLDRGLDHDNVVVLRGVSWELYKALSTSDDRPGIRMTYLDGELEIMSPSTKHEVSKKLLARFLECFAEERSIALNGFGSTTYRRKKKQGGLEPDECYTLGPDEKKVPDLAIEVVLRGTGVNKLEVYRRLGVSEVWCWVDDHVDVFHLEDGHYRPAPSSRLIPALDLDQLARAISATDPFNQMDALRAYRASLRAPG